MSTENSERKNEMSPEEKEEWIRKTANRIYSNMYASRSRPTLKEVAEGYHSILKFQLEVLAPLTHDILKKRRQEEEEKIRKFRDESNITKIGEYNILASVEKTIQKEHLFLQLIYQRPEMGNIRSPLDEPKKHIKKKKNWGNFENMTRSEYSKRVDQILSMSEENRINLLLAEAEAMDRRTNAINRKDVVSNNCFVSYLLK
jgi:hypothetical protein